MAGVRKKALTLCLQYPFIDWLKIDDFWNRRKDVVRDATLPGASAETRLGVLQLQMTMCRDRADLASLTAAFFVWVRRLHRSRPSQNSSS